MIKINLKNKGYTLVELLFYIAIFTSLSLVVINSMFVMAKSFKETTIQAELAKGGLIMERISREVRQATSINTISTTDLKINTTDDAGTITTIEFLASGTNVQIFENDVLVGDLNSSNIKVSGLTFTRIDTAKSSAVKISFSVASTNDSQNRTLDFYDTVVFRGSY
jgi:Tfp pilus assembly protein PilE